MIREPKSWIENFRQAVEEPELFAGRFRVEGEAGVGAMGIVYRAIDGESGATVALKILRETNERRFEREARALAGLSHPAIVGYVTHGISEEGEPYLVMQWIEGETLGQRLARAPLELRETIALGRRIAQALEAAHGMGLIHRDVKPSNVLLPGRRAEDAQLADFGIARFVDAERRPTSATGERAVGTPGYMAPEQVRAHRDLDGRADLFALGCLLFRCITQREAFDGPDAFTIIAKLLLHEPPRVRTLAPEVPPALDALVARLLNKDPAKRPGTAREVDTELDRAARELARPGLRKRRRLGRAAALGLAAMALVAAGGAWMRRAPAAHIEAPAPAVRVTDLPASPSCHPEAVAAYRDGLQAIREATWERAHHAFERAFERDPSCPEVVVRLVMTSEIYAPIGQQREYLRRAQALRGALRERDRAVLDSTAVFIVSEVPDRPAAVRILEEALRHFPRDAELLSLASHTSAAAATDAGTLETDLARAREAADIDPLYADAWQLQGRILAQLGRVEDHLSALDRCIQVAPGAGDCLRDRILVLRRRGMCQEAVAESRRWMARDPESALAYRDLAASLAATGAPHETLLEALSMRWKAQPAGEAETMRLHDLVKVAVWTGDFEQALRLAEQLEKHVTGAANAEAHVRANLMQVETLQEIGRSGEAARLAARVMRQKDAWTHGDMSIDRHESGAYYYEPVMLAAQLEQGQLTPALWAEGIRTWESTARMNAFERWAIAWGSAAGKGIDANAASKLAPPGDPSLFEPFGVAATHVGLLDAYEGHLYLEAGENARALESLQTAAKSCQGLDQPFANVRAHLWLGLAKERTGDVPGACAAYRVVLDRWGAAKPPSLSAREAAQRSRTLGCRRP
ncbi:serine/threonine-protein kinase [Pendulispora brunnea]|uniref:Serine/threonine-protein kinase n=1 Tax=Pendulispora brunnea TaxID=2905690 RepID=A0ABZ2K6T3_9BACT